MRGEEAQDNEQLPSFAERRASRQWLAEVRRHAAERRWSERDRRRWERLWERVPGADSLSDAWTHAASFIHEFDADGSTAIAVAKSVVVFDGARDPFDWWEAAAARLAPDLVDHVVNLRWSDQFEGAHSIVNELESRTADAGEIPPLLLGSSWPALTELALAAADYLWTQPPDHLGGQPVEMWHVGEIQAVLRTFPEVPWPGEADNDTVKANIMLTRTLNAPLKARLERSHAANTEAGLNRLLTRAGRAMRASIIDAADRLAPPGGDVPSSPGFANVREVLAWLNRPQAGRGAQR